MLSYAFSPIAVVRSPFRQKFGIPRQPHLAPSAEICIEFQPEFGADCVRGLADFGYLWVQFVFHGVLDEGWSPLVRPPRLGGKQKMGVFATRSPHRPNPLGLSLLKLERIEHSRPLRIWCSGADLLDGTPVLDIKPYLPFVEARPDAAAGFAAEPPSRLTVVWQTDPACLPEALRRLVEESIAQDPRPAYQNLPERIYVMALAGYEIRFRIADGQAVVLAAEPSDGVQEAKGGTEKEAT